MNSPLGNLNPLKLPLWMLLLGQLAAPYLAVWWVIFALGEPPGWLNPAAPPLVGLLIAAGRWGWRHVRRQTAVDPLPRRANVSGHHAEFTDFEMSIPRRIVVDAAGPQGTYRSILADDIADADRHRFTCDTTIWVFAFRDGDHRVFLTESYEDVRQNGYDLGEPVGWADSRQRRASRFGSPILRRPRFRHLRRDTLGR